jgi:MOSC domain-containing protein YiiM
MATSNMKTLLDTLPQVGAVDWIGIRPEKRSALQVMEAVEVTEADGLAGDHYSGRSKNRQVTLIQAEHLQGVADILGKPSIDPGLTRRNIVVSGVNLLAFADRRFRIGEVILEMTGPCHPCSRMEENLGAGGYNAMRGHGGITACVIKGGKIRKGDTVRLERNSAAEKMD